jgi:hypothetical protein
MVVDEFATPPPIGNLYQVTAILLLFQAAKK